MVKAGLPKMKPSEVFDVSGVSMRLYGKQICPRCEKISASGLCTPGRLGIKPGMTLDDFHFVCISCSDLLNLSGIEVGL